MHIFFLRYVRQLSIDLEEIIGSVGSCVFVLVCACRSISNAVCHHCCSARICVSYVLISSLQGSLVLCNLRSLSTMRPDIVHDTIDRATAQSQQRPVSMTKYRLRKKCGIVYVMSSSWNNPGNYALTSF